MKWLSWALDNLWTVIIIGGVLVQMLQAVMKKKGGGEEAPPPHEEATFDDPELAERTRKIREDIQRRIQQRAKGYAEEQPALPSKEPVEAPPVIREVAVTRATRPATSHVEVQRQAEILEEQAALMEKLQEAKAMKAAAAKRIEYEAATADHSAAARTAVRDTVVGDLRSPAALRRAFVLREVLGPPVALRR
jgi:hypothetical protein